MTTKALSVADLRARRIKQFCDHMSIYLLHRCLETNVTRVGLKTYMTLIERDMLLMEEEFELTTLLRLLGSEPQCEAQFKQYVTLKKLI